MWDCRAMAEKQQHPLLAGPQASRIDAARELGIFSPPETELAQSRLVVYLARIDGMWRGTVAGANGPLEHFESATLAGVQEQLCAMAVLLASPHCSDDQWSTTQAESVFAEVQDA